MISRESAPRSLVLALQVDRVKSEGLIFRVSAQSGGLY